MVKIRLARQGSGNNKFYRIVALDESSKRNGEALEILGFWHPSKNLKELENKKIEAWLAKGAQLSPAVKTLLKK